MTLSQFAIFLWAVAEPILVAAFFIGVIILGCLWLLEYVMRKDED